MMAVTRLRFSGRFLFAEPSKPDGASKGVLNVLALALKDHRVFMTVPRGSTLPRSEWGPDFEQPAFSLVTGNKVSVEHLVWDCAGRRLAVKGNSPFGWGAGEADQLADLGAIEHIRGNTVTFNPAHAEGGSADVASLVAISTGSGVTKRGVDKKYNFVPQGDGVNSSRRVYEDSRLLADLVEVTVDAPSLTIDMGTGRDGRAYSVTVVGRNDVDTVVTFSNLCPSGSVGVIDAEFAEYYRLFNHEVEAADRLVAEEHDPFGDIWTSCYLSIRARY
jgi:hypothetical protein